ncbi:MAG TPA: glycosyltransferase [Steroidobacteraceae bacterium]|nr:glycosyltransferase [Steroidobacteraceae bacterium]
MTRQRTVLLIAFHFPPIKGGSGVQRTLRFTQYLPKFGWRPIVLSIDPRAYEERANVVGNEVSADLLVERAFGLDTARHLSLFGRYPERLALPDRWMTWQFAAVRAALRIVKEHNVDAIWSTFPIATAHVIGMRVAKRTALPWIAEFRDPMWQSDWPIQPVANRYWRALEEQIIAHADKVVFVAPSAIQMYATRYPAQPTKKFGLLPNGYDEESFARAAMLTPPPRQKGPVVLLHSGIVYGSERNPTQLFAALASLKAKGAIDSARLQIVLRDAGAEADFKSELQRLQIDDLVRFAPLIDYLTALREMTDVDGLLLLQAANCNAQVPAKLYEYLRAKRPILALTDAAGDTARTLDAVNAGLIGQLDSAADIEAKLLLFLKQLQDNSFRKPAPGTVEKFSRESQSGQLAQLLMDLVAAREHG